MIRLSDVFPLRWLFHPMLISNLLWYLVEIIFQILHVKMKFSSPNQTFFSPSVLPYLVSFKNIRIEALISKSYKKGHLRHWLFCRISYGSFWTLLASGAQHYCENVFLTVLSSFWANTWMPLHKVPEPVNSVQRTLWDNLNTNALLSCLFPY